MTLLGKAKKLEVTTVAKKHRVRGNIILTKWEKKLFTHCTL